ncbi:unnamed protein product [Anisakis simplex]|uniref:Bestrophin homolog n=1 Tax=Anisakis simplex TaxID=6269 RepID=A0A0M3KAJ2_ANISI|nr:unnamed protein product [Anisakis simplex]
MIYRLRKTGKIDADVLMNSMLQWPLTEIDRCSRIDLSVAIDKTFRDRKSFAECQFRSGGSSTEKQVHNFLVYKRASNYEMVYESICGGNAIFHHPYDNSQQILQEIRLFRTNLAELCNYDWVPVPLAYPQVVFLAVRVYFIICLVARQYIIGDQAANKSPIDLRVPFMTMLQFVFYMGWVKVAESLLNPMGEDDDDFEVNFLIDKNIATALRIVDEGYNSYPDQKIDPFMCVNEPLYSTATAHRPVGELVGSVAAVNLAEEGTVKMVPHEPDHAKNDQSAANHSSLHLRNTAAHRPRAKSCRPTMVDGPINAGEPVKKRSKSIFTTTPVSPVGEFARQWSVPPSTKFETVGELDEEKEERSNV